MDFADLARLAEPSVITNPYPLLAELREASPFGVFDGALLVFGRYEDCSRILRDARASSERERSLLVERGAGARQRPPSFLSLDPPDHTRLRRLVSKAFTPRVVARLSPRIEQVTNELIDVVRAAGGREFELVGRLAHPLPVRIISELLGVPPGDYATFADWSAKLAHSVQPQFVAADSAETLAQAEQAGLEFAEYFTSLIAARRSSPGDDLLTLLIRAEESGDRLSTEELISTCVLLLVAGHETTVGLISNAMLALLRHPDELAVLAADQDLAGSAVEETLRYDPPVQLTGRVARGGLTLDGIEPPDGTVLLLLLAATGRDPAVFDSPDLFDVRRGAREGRTAREHLAFAAGPHFCLGAPLARLEATIALRTIAARMAGLELIDESLVYKPNLSLRGPERMVIGFDAIAENAPKALSGASLRHRRWSLYNFL